MRYLLAIVFVAAFATGAGAEDFDPTGWKLLGAETPRGRGNGELEVSSPHGAIDRVAIVVFGGSAEVVKVTVATLHKTEIDEEVGRTLDAEQPSYAFKIKRSKRARRILVEFDNADGRSRVAVFARDSRAKKQAVLASTSTWSSAGWTELGTEELDGERFAILWSSLDIPMDQLALVPTADLEVSRMGAHLRDGDDEARFEETRRTAWRRGEAHLIDLTTQPSAVGVKLVYFSYIINGASSAEVTLYGMPRNPTTGATVVSTPASGPADPWIADGWTLIGEDQVDLIEDEVVIDRDDSTWSKLAVVATGDEVTLESMEVHLAGKAEKVHRTEISETLTDGTRSRIIDITGKRRAIEKVRLQYKKHKLDGSTRVQVYAR